MRWYSLKTYDQAMGIVAVRAISAVVLSGILVSWSSFHSKTYPYTMMRPSSFTFAKLRTTGHSNVDYFFPALGSFTTNVNISATPGRDHRSERSYLLGEQGKNVHRSGWITIMGHRRALMSADFVGLVSRWRLEQVVLYAGKRTWRLTASYDRQYRKLRPVMLRMLRSFRTRK